MFTVIFFDNFDIEYRTLATAANEQAAADTAYKYALRWFGQQVWDFVQRDEPLVHRTYPSKGVALQIVKSTYGSTVPGFQQFWTDFVQWCCDRSQLPADFTRNSKYPGDFIILDTHLIEEFDFDLESSI